MSTINNKSLTFIRKRFELLDAARDASLNGAIVFDTNSRAICVGGQTYGSNVKDVTFDGNTLTLTIVRYSDEEPIEINLSDIASAGEVMNALESIAYLIGVSTEGGELGLDYSRTHYLGELGTDDNPVKNLVNADRLLDQKIYEVENAVAALRGDFETIVSHDAGSTPFGVQWIDDTDTENPETITGTLEAGESTRLKIYLVPAANGDGINSYDEYITTRTESSDSTDGSSDGGTDSYNYFWEKLGSRATSGQNNVWTGTQAEYDAIQDKDANTIYCITDGTPTLYWDEWEVDDSSDGTPDDSSDGNEQVIIK